MISEVGNVSEVVVGLDVHLKNTQVTVMKSNGEVVKKERIKTSKAELRRSLETVPEGSRVALESVCVLDGLMHRILLHVACPAQSAFRLPPSLNLKRSYSTHI